MSFSDAVLIGTFVLVAVLLGSRLTGFWMSGTGSSSPWMPRRKSRKIDPATFTEQGALINPGDVCYPVRYCTGRRFRRPLRLVPWDAVGVFVVNDAQFRFLGKTTRGDSLRLAFPRNDSFISYVEKMFWRDGGLSWFSIEAHGKKFFFSSEGTLPNLSPTSTMTFSTTGIYEKMTERFSNL